MEPNEAEKIETSHTDIFPTQLVAGPSSEEPVSIHSHLALNTLNMIVLVWSSQCSNIHYFLSLVSTGPVGS